MIRFVKRMVLASFACSGAITACNCDTTTFAPDRKYNPDQVLDFGKVSVLSEKTLPIKVTSDGTSAFIVSMATFANQPTDAPAKWKWRVNVPDALMKGLAPQRTSSITVTYRPCPEAWVDGTNDAPGMMLKSHFDYSQCSGNADSAELDTTEPKTTKGGTKFTISGQPVQPPSLAVKCQNGMVACNSQSPMLIECLSMTYGTVSAGSTPCDMVVEIHDQFRMGKPVGELDIEQIEITVQDINTLPNGATRKGEDVGFTVLDMSGNPLNPTSSNPFAVTIPEGQQDGSKQFKIRFTGSRTGSWFGSSQFGMTGVRLYTNDPDNPIKTFNISGTGSAPQIEVFPVLLTFGPVEQNRTKTLTATVTNAGDADLQITQLKFMKDTNMSTFAVTTSKGMPPFKLMPNETAKVRVSYTPAMAGTDSDVLLIGNNDTQVMGVVQVPVSGGAVPKISLNPADTLVYPIASSAMPRTEMLGAQNIGYGNLQISRIEILGQQGMMTPSVMDFSIAECNGTPQACDLSISLCPPSSPTCSGTMSQTTFHIAYQNHDISETDYAELHVHSNDPTDPDHIVVLEAHDQPCFPPNPVITVMTPRPCKGQPVMVSGSMSQANGVMGMMSTVTGYNWSFNFTPQPTPTISPNNAVNAMFTPQASGFYILVLDVTNSCGAVSQNSATETISVADTCN